MWTSFGMRVNASLAQESLIVRCCQIVSWTAQRGSSWSYCSLCVSQLVPESWGFLTRSLTHRYSGVQSSSGLDPSRGWDVTAPLVPEAEPSAAMSSVFVSPSGVCMYRKLLKISMSPACKKATPEPVRAAVIIQVRCSWSEHRSTTRTPRRFWKILAPSFRAEVNLLVIL